MSASATGLGSNKKGGRVSDASAVTAQRRIIAQGQADSTYSSIQKKNGFRTSKSVLNSEQYNSSVLVAQNLGIAASAPAPFVCPSITVEDIATFNESYSIWILNADTTILPCQTLTIPNTYNFFINSKNLTNNGTIINESGALFGCGPFVGESPGTFTNNGTCINNGYLGNYDYGIINNNGTIENQSGGTFSNQFQSIITNNGTIANQSGGTIENLSGGTFSNTGPFNNAGNFNNAGIIYVYNGGIINGSGSIANSGTISVADGTSTCGTGTLSIIPSPSGTQNNNCPP